MSVRGITEGRVAAVRGSSRYFRPYPALTRRAHPIPPFGLDRAAEIATYHKAISQQLRL
jgi:hypothetical protein